MLPQAGERAPGLELVDLELNDANLANVDARGASLRRVVLRRCRLTGVLLTEGRLRDVVIAESRVDLASFAACTLEQVVFDDCRMEGSSLQEARLRHVRFERCDLSEADLSGARFELSELRSCTIDRVRGAAALRGAAMPWSDIVSSARTLADALGIRMLDDLRSDETGDAAGRAGRAGGCSSLGAASTFPCRWNWDLLYGNRPGYVTAGNRRRLRGRAGSLTLKIRLLQRDDKTQPWRHASNTRSRNVPPPQPQPLRRAAPRRAWRRSSKRSCAGCCALRVARVVARHVVHTGTITVPSPNCVVM